MTEHDKLHLKRYRHYHPYHSLFKIARTAVTEAENNMENSYYFQVTAMVFSFLAVESVANSFGRKFESDWERFEKKPTIKKIRALCNRLNIEYDKNPALSNTLSEMKQFRDRVVHAKSEDVTDYIGVSYNTDISLVSVPPKSNIEQSVSLDISKKHLQCADAILEMLLACLSDEEYGEFFCDSTTGELV